jgi:hypothetical protein
MIESLKNNPVRIYGVVAAALALVAHYVPDLPSPLILALAAALLGVGESVRSAVVPVRKIEWLPENDGEVIP